MTAKIWLPSVSAAGFLGIFLGDELFWRRIVQVYLLFLVFVFSFLCSSFSLYGNIVSINKFVLSRGDTYPNRIYSPCLMRQRRRFVVVPVLGNVLRDDFEEVGDNNPLLWQIRSRELLEDCVVDGKAVGYGSCPDKYICGGCRAKGVQLL